MSSFRPFEKFEEEKEMKRNYYDSLELKEHMKIQKRESLERARRFFQKKNSLPSFVPTLV